MAKIARALERGGHAPAGDGCASTGSRRVRRDMNVLVGRRGASGRRARRIIRVSIERHSTAARLISLEGAASAGGHALAIDERSTARHALIDARATVTVGDNAVPNAQSTLLSEHNSHGGLFLRRFRNAPDAASATTTFLRQRRSCDGDVSATAAPFAIAAFFAMAMPYAITASFAMVAPSVMATSFVMAASSASRDYAKHSIMNASVSFSFWHKFAVVNDGFFGTQKALYKRPGQKRGMCQSAQKRPSARRKIVHNRKFVPELPKSGHVFGKAGTKGSSRTKRSRKMRAENKGAEARTHPANERLQEAKNEPRIGGDAKSKNSKTSSVRKAKARHGSTSRMPTQIEQLRRPNTAQAEHLRLGTFICMLASKTRMRKHKRGGRAKRRPRTTQTSGARLPYRRMEE